MRVSHAKVGDLAEQIRGVSYAKQDASLTPQPGYVPVLRANNITDDGLVFDDLVFVPAERVSKKQRVRQHDVVVAASSGSLDVVGKAAVALADFEGGFGAFCKVLRPNSKVHPLYFSHFFKTRHYRQRVSALAAGANINNLRNEHLDELEIPLPPLTDQGRIAAILDQAEALRAKRRHALTQLDILTQSLFLEMFGDPARHGWPEKSVAALASNIRTGPFGSQLLHSEFVDAGIAVLGIDNAVQNQFVWGRPRFITEHKFRQLKRYQVSPSDVLITIMGTCGRCAVVPDDIPTAINTKHLCCITLDYTQCLSTYLHACFLLHPHVLHRLGIRERGAVMPGLNMQVIKELMIPVPPLPLQHEFAAQVEAVKRLKVSHRTSLTKLEALFASLQHRAFRGEL